jgi:hypothetical protein
MHLTTIMKTMAPTLLTKDVDAGVAIPSAATMGVEAVDEVLVIPTTTMVATAAMVMKEVEDMVVALELGTTMTTIHDFHLVLIATATEIQIPSAPLARCPLNLLGKGLHMTNMTECTADIHTAVDHVTIEKSLPARITSRNYESQI